MCISLSLGSWRNPCVIKEGMQTVDWTGRPSASCGCGGGNHRPPWPPRCEQWGQSTASISNTPAIWSTLSNLQKVSIKADQCWARIHRLRNTLLRYQLCIWYRAGLIWTQLLTSSTQMNAHFKPLLRGSCLFGVSCIVLMYMSYCHLQFWKYVVTILQCSLFFLFSK